MEIAALLPVISSWTGHRRGAVHYQEGCGIPWLWVEHCPWEASSYWVSQIAHIFGTRKLIAVLTAARKLVVSSPGHSTLIVLLRLCRPSDLLPSYFATKPCKYVSSPRASYMFGPSHSSVTTILACKSRSSSLRSFLQSPVTPFYLPPDIPQYAVPHNPQPM